MTITARPPTRRNGQSTVSPGCTSATRTAPTGASPEVATVTARATAAPATTATRDLVIDSAIRCGRGHAHRGQRGVVTGVDLQPAGDGLAHDHQAEQGGQPGEGLQGDDLRVGGLADLGGDGRRPLEGDGLVGDQGPDPGGEGVDVSTRLQPTMAPQ